MQVKRLYGQPPPGQRQPDLRWHGVPHRAVQALAPLRRGPHEPPVPLCCHADRLGAMRRAVTARACSPSLAYLGASAISARTHLLRYRQSLAHRSCGVSVEPSVPGGVLCARTHPLHQTALLVEGDQYARVPFGTSVPQIRQSLPYLSEMKIRSSGSSGCRGRPGVRSGRGTAVGGRPSSAFSLLMPLERTFSQSVTGASVARRLVNVAEGFKSSPDYVRTASWSHRYPGSRTAFLGSRASSPRQAGMSGATSPVRGQGCPRSQEDCDLGKPTGPG